MPLFVFLSGFCEGVEFVGGSCPALGRVAHPYDVGVVACWWPTPPPMGALGVDVTCPDACTIGAQRQGVVRDERRGPAWIFLLTVLCRRRLYRCLVDWMSLSAAVWAAACLLVSASRCWLAHRLLLLPLHCPCPFVLHVPLLCPPYSVRPQRESALLELSKKREASADLAPILWTSFGTVAALLQEIISIYPLLWPPALTAHASNRVCNSLALLQCVASHPDTRSLFLAAHIPLFLYPFLNTVSKTRPFEYLRLTSLGVIGALVKMDDPDVINFLLQTEIIPLCLRIMETGSELSKTVATFVVQKILLDANGLAYICAAAERFYAVANVLSNMVKALVQAPSPRLLKHVIRCYLRLSDNQRAREALRGCLPKALQDGTFAKILDEDPTTKRWLVTLLYALDVDNAPLTSLPPPGQ